MEGVVRIACALVLILTSLAPGTAGAAAQDAAPQTQSDDFTRYELQAPESHAFRILYDVTATTPGAPYYFNSIRSGAEEEVHGVTDLATGRELEWIVVSGSEARTQGHPRASESGRYIRVTLSRPVPDGGEQRIRIDKTYVDPESYFEEDGTLVFDRSLGIKRNAVVLPRGFELIGANHPSQVGLEPDGRIRVSFMNVGPASVPYRVEARALPAGSPPPGPLDTQAALPGYEPEVAAGPAVPMGVRLDHEVGQRATQDREIVYYLLDPETHSFRLYHDYTETRIAVDRYLNVVRRGSSASDPEAYLLDTGEALEVETLKGMEISRAGIRLNSPVTPETEVVVIWFDPVRPGESKRLRIWETYTDPNRYMLAGDELVWDRAFGRPRNAVVLPAGWFLTHSDIPGRVSLTEDDRVRIDFWNDRQGNIQVFIKARRRGE
jgi:hypothetical protein